MSHSSVQHLCLDRVRKVIVAGLGACRVRVTVLGGVSLRIASGEAVAVTGVLPLARSMLCAIAAGVARCDSGRVQWSDRGLTGVRYAPIGDAPRVLHLRADTRPGLVILDAALVEHAPEPDIPALVPMVRAWIEAGGAVLVAAQVTPAVWPWRICELAGGQLRAVSDGGAVRASIWGEALRHVAERPAARVAPGVGQQ